MAITVRRPKLNWRERLYLPAIVAGLAPSFSSIASLPDKRVQLSLAGISNLNYQVDVSTDLVNWSALTDLTIGSSSGISANVRMGYERQSTLVTRD